MCVCAGAFHPGHAAPLHIQPSRDDPVGEGYLRSPATIGEFASGWSGAHLGTRGPAPVPGQVSELCGLCGEVDGAVHHHTVRYSVVSHLSVYRVLLTWCMFVCMFCVFRLVYEEERVWTEENIDSTALKYFPSLDRNAALARPILFSDWLTKNYLPVDREELREYVQARLKVFYEEELDVPLVLFDEVLEHVLRIDRIFKQHQGHLLLIGVSGSGKTTLSRFVAWINGLSVVQVKVHNNYSAADFDEDLRNVLRRSGCKVSALLALAAVEIPTVQVLWLWSFVLPVSG